MAGSREQLLELLRRDDIHDRRVLQAMAAIPRERFVPEKYREQAWENHPLPIGFDQTISQPYTVAYMAELLQLVPCLRVLEIGGGCGYSAAVMASIVGGDCSSESQESCQQTGRVHSIELEPELARIGARNLSDCGCSNAQLLHGNGRNGLPQYAPFDRIVLAAATEDIPQLLFDQLAENGILLAPVYAGGSPGRPDGSCIMMRWLKTGPTVTTEQHGLFRFVPLRSNE